MKSADILFIGINRKIILLLRTSCESLLIRFLVTQFAITIVFSLQHDHQGINRLLLWKRLSVLFVKAKPHNFPKDNYRKIKTKTQTNKQTNKHTNKQTNKQTNNNCNNNNNCHNNNNNCNNNNVSIHKFVPTSETHETSPLSRTSEDNRNPASRSDSR